MRSFLSELKILFIPCAENDFRPHFLKSKFLLYYVVALVVVNILAAGFLASLPKTTFFADVTESALIVLTNEERVSLGLAPLKENVQLNEVAYQKAKDMLENGYFAHSSPTGITPWYWFKNVGYSYQAAGENLAVGFIDSKEVVDAWVESPSHRANLLSPDFQEIGIAVVTGEFNGEETTLVVQSFGAPVKAAERPVGEIKTEAPIEKVAGEMIGEKAEGAGPVVAAAAQFITVDYFDIAQRILFYSIVLIALALVLNIFIHIKTQDKSLILRSIVFLAILAGLMALMGRDTILQIVPHHFQI